MGTLWGVVNSDDPTQSPANPSDSWDRAAPRGLEEAPPASSALSSRVERAAEPSHGGLVLEPAEARMVRSLARWMSVTGLFTLGIVGALSTQWKLAPLGVPLGGLGAMVGAVGLWNLLAALHLRRIPRDPARARRELVKALSSLRGILILKSWVLFLALGLACLSFSLVAALLASL